MKKELVANNFKWLFSDKILEIGFGFILNVWIARVIGVDNFGRIAVVLAIMALVDPICNLCIRTKVVAMLVANQLKESYVLSNTFAITLASSFLVSCGISILSTIFMSDNSLKIITIIFASTLPFKAFGFAEYYFESKLKAKYLFRARKSAFAISLIGKIVAICFFSNWLIPIALSIAIEPCIYSLMLFAVYTEKNCPKLSIRDININAQKMLIKHSYPLILAAFCSALMLKIGQILLPILTDETAAGNFAIAQKFVESANFLPLVITQSTFPVILEEIENGQLSNGKKLLKTGIILSYSGIAITLGIVIFGPTVVGLLYGQQYKLAPDIVGILALSMVFVFSFSLRKKILIALDETPYLLKFSVVSGIASLCITYVLTKMFGLYGTALALPVGWLFAIVVIPLCFNKREEVIFFIKTLNPKKFVERTS